MKKLIVFICMLLFSSNSFSQAKWEYPIKLGTPEWKAIKTMEEVYAVQQIPEDILKKMTTKEVFHAWLDLPGRLEVLAYNSMQKGFDITVKRFNVIPELLKRPDVGKVVLEYYLSLDPSGIYNETTDEKKGSFITDYGFIEFLLSQPDVIKTLPKSQMKSLYKKITYNINIKLNFEDKERDPFWIETELVLAGRLLDAENYQKLKERISKNPHLNKSLVDGNIYSREVFQDIYDSILEVAADNK